MRKMEAAGVQMSDAEIEAVAGGDEASPATDVALAGVKIAEAVAALAPPPPPPPNPCIRDGKWICEVTSIRG